MTDSRTAMEELNADERVAVVMLSESVLTTDEIIELINNSFRQRHYEILFPTQPHDA